MYEKSTEELTKELCEREGITHLRVNPYEKITIRAGGKTLDYTGPAIIVINQD